MTCLGVYLLSMPLHFIEIICIYHIYICAYRHLHLRISLHLRIYHPPHFHIDITEVNIQTS